MSGGHLTGDPDWVEEIKDSVSISRSGENNRMNKRLKDTIKSVEDHLRPHIDRQGENPLGKRMQEYLRGILGCPYN